jgi:hypothetical protein
MTAGPASGADGRVPALELPQRIGAALKAKLSGDSNTKKQPAGAAPGILAKI